MICFYLKSFKHKRAQGTTYDWSSAWAKLAHLHASSTSHSSETLKAASSTKKITQVPSKSATNYGSARANLQIEDCTIGLKLLRSLHSFVATNSKFKFLLYLLKWSSPVPNWSYKKCRFLLFYLIIKSVVNRNNPELKP